MDQSCFCNMDSAPASSDAGFEAWLAVRKLVLSRPMRDASGVLLRPGMPALAIDPANPGNVLHDTPENRAKLRAEYEREGKAAQDAAEAVQKKLKEAADAKTAQKFALAVRETADGLIAMGKLSVSLPRFRENLILRYGEFAAIDLALIRSALLELQDSAQDKYAVCVGADGTEMFRKATALGSTRRIFT